MLQTPELDTHKVHFVKKDESDGAQTSKKISEVKFSVDTNFESKEETNVKKEKTKKLTHHDQIPKARSKEIREKYSKGFF